MNLWICRIYLYAVSRRFLYGCKVSALFRKLQSQRPDMTAKRQVHIKLLDLPVVSNSLLPQCLIQFLPWYYPFCPARKTCCKNVKLLNSCGFVESARQIVECTIKNKAEKEEFKYLIYILQTRRFIFNCFQKKVFGFLKKIL